MEAPSPRRAAPARPTERALVPFDFESGHSWVDALAAAGFDRLRPSLVASMGVSQYITAEALQATMREVAGMAPGTVFVCSFIVRADLIEEEEHGSRAATEERTAASGHPWVSSFVPGECAALAAAAGFEDIGHVSSAEPSERYFSARTDGLRPSSSEELLVATRR